MQIEWYTIYVGLERSHTSSSFINAIRMFYKILVKSKAGYTLNTSWNETFKRGSVMQRNQRLKAGLASWLDCVMLNAA